MRLPLPALLASSLLVGLAGTIGAQTTGVPGVNDMTVNGATSGSSSCSSVTITLGGPANFQITGSPSAGLGIFLSLVPCAPCSVPLSAANTCSPAIPFSACAGTTNQSIDINATLLSAVNFIGATDLGGTFTLNLTIPNDPILDGITLSAQGFLLDPICNAPPYGVLATQSYSMTFML